jgi:hypothetical protein
MKRVPAALAGDGEAAATGLAAAAGEAIGEAAAGATGDTTTAGEGLAAAALVAGAAGLAAVEGAEVGAGEALWLPQAADSRPSPTIQARDGRVKSKGDLHQERYDRAAARPPLFRLSRLV